MLVKLIAADEWRTWYHIVQGMNSNTSKVLTVSLYVKWQVLREEPMRQAAILIMYKTVLSVLPEERLQPHFVPEI